MNRKRLNRVLCLCLCALLLTACGGPKQEDTVVPLKEKVLEIASDAAELTEVSEEEMRSSLGARSEEYEEFVFLRGSGTDTREILAFRSVTPYSAEDLALRAEIYLKHRRNDTRDTQPEAFEAYSKASVMIRNLTVVLVIGPDAARETSAILSGE